MTSHETVELPAEFEALSQGVVLHDPETGAIIDVNGTAERLYGYPASELRSMDVVDFTAPSTRFTQAEVDSRVRAAAAGESQSFDWQVERASGEIRWVAVDLTDITVDGVDAVLAEVRDVTEYKTRERRLRLLNRVIRHNLRNDTNVLMGYADRLKTAVESDPLESQVETIREIAEDIGALSDSITQFEAIADPNGMARSRTRVDRIVREVVADARDEHPDADVTVVEDERTWVNADEGLRYALDHAVENAVVHSDRERPTVEVTVTRDPESGRGEVRITDDGPTIPEIEIEVLDGDETKTSTYHGSGIGLWVMQWCVDSLGGELVFEANEPRGNVVRLLLPLDDGERS